MTNPSSSTGLRARSGRWALALALLTSTCARTAEAADGPSLEALARADDLYQRGNRAFDEGDLQGAYALYVEAWSIKKGIDIAANLGIVELKLGKPRDAAEHIAYSLRLFPAQGKPEARARLLEKLGEAKQAIATVKLTVDVAGAAVHIDGVEVGRSPIEQEVYVEPGTRVVRASLAGHETAESRAELVAGSSSELRLSLRPLPAPAASAQPSEARPAGAPKPLWPALALGGGVAVGAGLGLTFTLLGLGEEGSVEGVRCPGGADTCPADALSAIDRRNTFMTVGAAGFVVGGASLAGLITYLAWPNDDGPASGAASLELVPLAGADRGGLTLRGSF